MLHRIARHKWEEVIKRKKEGYYLDALANPFQCGPTRKFMDSLKKEPGLAVIAELKKASPSKGILRHHYIPENMARDYQAYGAAALSVLTDRVFFKGHENHLRQVKKAVLLPVLRKDFLVDPMQIYESRYIGADAVLLIAGLLVTREIAYLMKLAEELGMESIVEVCSEEETARAVEAGAKIIQINNRDLKTFSVDLEKTKRLAPLIPRNCLLISASGISTAAAAGQMAKAGARALLVGEALVKRKNPGSGIKELQQPYETCSF